MKPKPYSMIHMPESFLIQNIQIKKIVSYC